MVSESSYFSDAERLEEMVRLNHLAKLATDGIGGVWPELSEQELSGVHDVLDLACGPGEWVMRIASTYPSMRAVGVDKSKRVIAYANARAKVEESKAAFQLMDVTEPLDFSDASFDLVNARFILGFMKRAQWAPLLAEIYRLLRPGGIIRITEQESGFANDPIYQQYIDLWGNAWRKSGHAFAHTSAYIGVCVVMKQLMREAGFIDPKHRPIAIDLSTGEPAHQETLSNLMMALQLARPFLLKIGVATQAQVDELYEQMGDLIGRPGFSAYWYLQTTWAHKPWTWER